MFDDNTRTIADISLKWCPFASAPHLNFHVGSQDGAGQAAEGPIADTRRGKSGIRRRAEGHNTLGQNLQRSLGTAPNKQKKAGG